MARPMKRLVPPLSALGARLEVSPEGRPPLRIHEAGAVHGASVTIPIASAQVRTAFELAALAGDRPSMIDSPGGFRDHTERWLRAIGLGEWRTETAFSISPGSIPPARYEIPGDPSSAAYLWACAAIHPSSSVTTPTVSLNPGRLGFLEILERMGARVDAVVTGATGGDPVGDVTVSSGDLNGVPIDGDLVAAALDELPLVAVVAAYAEGITSVRGAGELRAKESDRISSVVDMILALGGGIAEYTDGFDIIGTGFLEAGTVETNNDHRIAMSAAVAATRIDTPVIVRNAQIASVSWPGFYETLEHLWS
jgi:3-phosphoshikimate 1-carboxyvinyltransferase